MEQIGITQQNMDFNKIVPISNLQKKIKELVNIKKYIKSNYE